MYEIYTANKKTERKLTEYLKSREDLKEKLDKLGENPRKANGSHQLHGRLKGKYACWIGSNIRMIFSINENMKRVIIEAVGTHKAY